MLNNMTFYHGTIRKYIIAFGNLFNNIWIQRFNEDKTVAQKIKVPLEYASKARWFNRLQGDKVINDGSDDTVKVRQTLPRSAFEMSGLSVAMNRKLNTLQQMVAMKDSSNVASQYQRVPYDFRFSLFSIFKQYDDALQYVEQVLPYFDPYFTVNVNTIPELNIVDDIPIILNSVTPEIDDDGDKTFNLRSIAMNLEFTIQGYLYYPTLNKKIVSTQLDTGWSWHDNVEGSEKIFTIQTQYQSVLLNSNTKDFVPGEIIFQGTDIRESKKNVFCVSWDKSSKELKVVSVGSIFQPNDTVTGVKSGATGIVKEFVSNSDIILY